MCYISQEEGFRDIRDGWEWMGGKEIMSLIRAPKGGSCLTLYVF